ncbi:MAG: hypothetical protein IH877_03265 [Gemmatimonadetes bacterium]|nr:hypothetical protein [Gemmatimonadota bacterium]
MALNIKALSVTAAVLWGGSLFLVGVVNQIFANYGEAWLSLAASIYPGYDGPTGFGSIIVVTLYGLLDGAVGGAVFAWLYNLVATRRESTG